MGIIKIKQHSDMPCSKLTSIKYGDIYSELNSSTPIGLYNGSDGKKYAVLFNPYSYGYDDSKYFLESDLGFTDAHEKHDKYMLKYKGWSHGLSNESTIKQVFSWVEKVVPKEYLTDPAIASRYICAYISKSVHHNRLLQGCWGDDEVVFSKSLVDIFNNFEEGETSYGQCFIFSATLCGILKHVGLPAKQIVCTNAGHVCNNIQQQISRLNNGNEVVGSSIWNFHCWCEVYLAMYNNSGWCVIDATPQEPSYTNGILKDYYVCGPCPVSALNNIYNINNKTDYFDLKFISVNTRGVVSHGIEDNGLRILYHRDYNSTGTDIYAENEGVWDDVKNRYKPSSSFPYDDQGYYINISGNTATLSGDVPIVEVYLVLLESKHKSSNIPSAKSISSFEVIKLSSSGNNQYNFNNGYLKGWSHYFIVAGVKTKTKYAKKVNILTRWVSKQI
jgi:hypothetical protein